MTGELYHYKPLKVKGLSSGRWFDAGEMTQQQLADKVGVTRQTIIVTEQGRCAPSLPLAMKIARAFGKQVEEMFRLE